MTRRRCAYIDKAGARCNHIARQQSKFCSLHHEFDLDLKRCEFDRNLLPGATREQMAFYRQHLSPKLQDFYDQATQLETFNITEEIALLRTSALKYVQYFSAASELGDLANSVADPVIQKQHHELLTMAYQAMQQSLDDITKLVERQARITAAIADKLHPDTIKRILQQVCSLIHQEIGQDNFHLVERLNERLNSELHLTSLKDMGTELTPDQEVTAMDMTVPLWDESNVIDIPSPERN